MESFIESSSEHLLLVVQKSFKEKISKANIKNNYFKEAKFALSFDHQFIFFADIFFLKHKIIEVKLFGSFQN